MSFVNWKGNIMNKKLVVAGVSGALFLLLIVLLKTVNVENCGPENTAIGFAAINTGINEFFGENLIWYKITEVFGVLALLVAAFFAFIGAAQLVLRKSLAKVDKEIIAVGGLYAIVIVLYVFFEKVIINYRPMIMDAAEGPEASFPSSHTMLICVIMGSTIIMVKEYVEKISILRGIQIGCAVIMITTVIGRLVCGVHWFTDILGGVLISVALVFLFWACLDMIKAATAK